MPGPCPTARDGKHVPHRGECFLCGEPNPHVSRELPSYVEVPGRTLAEDVEIRTLAEYRELFPRASSEPVAVVDEVAETSEGIKVVAHVVPVHESLLADSPQLSFFDLMDRAGRPASAPEPKLRESWWERFRVRRARRLHDRAMRLDGFVCDGWYDD